jgi:P-type Ca2+ transporter type 2C
MSMNKQKNWYNSSITQVFEETKSSKDGLTSGKVKKLQKKYGLNELPNKKPTSKITLVINQIKSPLVYVLIFAVIISIVLGHYTDAGVICLVVVINTIFGYWQESKANNAAEKLKQIIKHTARVERDGGVIQIDSSQLVPGDVILLKSGDKIPADARLFEMIDLQTVEASLTGESTPIKKNIKRMEIGSQLADRKNMVYMGTMVSRGKAKAVVVATGTKTEIGKISVLIEEAKEIKTPLQDKLSHFSKWLTWVIVSISAVVFIQGYFANRDLIEMLLTVVALAVSAIPEGLLVAVTIILTFGMQFILKRKALVRKLVAAETLGSISVICTDKTGTLTEGVMRVSKIITANDEYVPSDASELLSLGKNRNLISKVSILCSNAIIENPLAELEHIKIIGDPTETSLLLASIQSGFIKDSLEKEYKQLAEIPFSSDTKYMATLHNHIKDKHQHVFVKGAPEKLFDFCKFVIIKGKKIKLDNKYLTKLENKYTHLTSQGLRVLGFAYKTGKFDSLKDELNDLVFLGFVAIKDPLRVDAKQTIQLCKRAGIRPVIITGDHKLTAKAIFEELGLKVDSNMVEGRDLDKWSDTELQDKVKNIDIYARVEPKHKLRIVNAWQAIGEVVAMTGDGINDAPAIKTADIGIAFGSGSDVTKETADIILLDNNFKVIVAAVEQGRIIFDNIRKVILYLLTDSFSQIILISGSLMLNLPLPFLVTQILWINLISDGLPNIAMALEPGEKEVMNEKPRKRNEPILNREMKLIIFFVGIFMDLILLVLFILMYAKINDIDYIRTVIFTASGVGSLFYAFSVRSLRHSVISKNPFKNKYLVGAVTISFLAFFAIIYIPFLQPVFHTVPLGWMEWGLIILLALFKVFLIEIVKHFSIVKRNC